MVKQLCNYPTPKGPCTMEKGHSVPYHRHREYDHSYWRILDNDGELLASGENMVPLNTALGRIRRIHDKIVVEIEFD